MSEIEKAQPGHLQRLATQNTEARDRRGYEQHPQEAVEIAVWEGVAAWPEL